MDKPKMAIAVDTIVDEDFGLISLIFNEYLDPGVFDLEKFKRPVPDIIKDLYTREEMNPLLSFMNDNCKDQADDLYNEFMSAKRHDILLNGIGTNIQNYIKLVKESNEFGLILFCYNKDQMDYIKELEEFNYANIIMFDDFANLKSTNQFYFKYVDQAFPLKDLVGSNFYFSTIGPNLNEAKDDIKSCDETELMKKTNYIRLYSLYDFEKLERLNSSEGEVFYDGLL